MNNMQKLLENSVYEHDLEDLIPAMKSRTSFYVLLSILMVVVGLTGLSCIIPCKQSLRGTAVFCPDHQTATIMLTSASTGEVRVGQKVFLYTFNYPESQYGYLRGKVTKIPRYSFDGQVASYSVSVQLDNGWTTSRGVRLRHSLPLQGEGEIIISERQLIEQVLVPVKNVLEGNGR